MYFMTFSYLFQLVIFILYAPWIYKIVNHQIISFKNMKFHSKNNLFPQDNLDETQFLTFRHNGTDFFQGTGRSLASQRFQYKSLQKIASSEFDEQLQPSTPQKQIPLHSMKKTLTNVKSQQFLKGMQNYQSNSPPFPSLQQSSIDINPQAKQQILKKKMDRLIRSIKKQQRKELSLQKQIQQIQKEIEDDNNDILQQEDNITELQDIYQENSKQCQRIRKNCMKLTNKNMNLKDHLKKLQRALQLRNEQICIYQAPTNLSNSKNLSIQTMKKQLIERQQIYQQICLKTQRLQRELQKIQGYLIESKQLSNQMKKLF